MIVPDAGADFSRGLLGESTPLAQAILGQAAGSLLPYTAGDARSVHILAVEAPDAPPPTEAVARRRAETLRQAVEQAQRTDAMIFASSFSGKWGDYDPKGIEQWETGLEPEQPDEPDPA